MDASVSKVMLFASGVIAGFALTALVYEHERRHSPYAPPPPPEAIVITRGDNVRCTGYVAAPPSFVGVPPRLWICAGEVPWYDATGMKIPTTTLGELP